MESGAQAMDHVPGDDMAEVAGAAHAVCQQAIDAGVLVCSGGLAEQRASIVVTDGPDPGAIGGVTVVDVPTRAEALTWAAKIAAACRCPTAVWEFGADPELDQMLRAARSR